MHFLQYNYLLSTAHTSCQNQGELSKHFLIEETKLMLNDNIPLKTDGCECENCIDVQKEYLLN